MELTFVIDTTIPVLSYSLPVLLSVFGFAMLYYVVKFVVSIFVGG